MPAQAPTHKTLLNDGRGESAMPQTGVIRAARGPEGRKCHAACGKGYHFCDEVRLLGCGPGWDAMGEATFCRGRRWRGRRPARGVTARHAGLSKTSEGGKAGCHPR